MVITFKYRSIVRPNLDPAKTPSIPIELIGRESVPIMALIDSGADLSAFPKSLGEALGLNLNGKRTTSEGINGPVEAVETSVEIVLEKGHEKYNFQMPVQVIMNDVDFPPLLGRDGFFDKFVITFDHLNQKVTLKKKSVSSSSNQ